MPFTWRSSESISQYIREVKSESVPDLLPNEPLSSSSCNIGIKASNEREQNSSGVTRFFPQFFFQKSVQSFVQKCNIIFRDSSFIKRQHYQRLHYQWPHFLGPFLSQKKNLVTLGNGGAKFGGIVKVERRRFCGRKPWQQPQLYSTCYMIIAA